MTPGRRPEALVLGSGLTALGVVRSLARAGVRARVAADPPQLVRWSRWYRAAGVGPCSPEEDLPRYLRSLEQGAVLFPCSDHTASGVAHLEAELAARFPASIAGPDSLDELVDKWRFASLLAQLDIPRPATVAIDAATPRVLPPLLFPRAFLKPRDSQAFFDRFEVKAFWVESRDQVAARLADLEPTGLEVILQEYIPGPATNHYFIDGFVDRHGTVATVFVRRRLRMYPLDFGNSSYMVSVAPEAAAPAVSSLKRLLAHTKYRGVFSAEFKVDIRDGAFKLLEVNTRPWWYVEFATQCGVNVCEMAYRDALGEPVTPVTDYAVGRPLVYPYYDFFACRGAHRQRLLSAGAWIRSWARATQPVLRWSDPGPAVAECIAFVGRRLRTARGRFRRDRRRGRRPSQPAAERVPPVTPERGDG